ncbi:MAG: transglutaminase domain-containing protein [Calditrichia bacterium]
MNMPIIELKQKYRWIKSNFEIIVIFILFTVYASFAVAQEKNLHQETAGIELSKSNVRFINPLAYDIEYIFELYPDLDKIDKFKDLKLWIPFPREWDSQKQVQLVSTMPNPHSEYTDKEYGNKFFFWNFGKYSNNSNYRVRIRFKFKTYEIKSSIDSSKIIPYNLPEEEFDVYLRSTKTINITPRIRTFALEAISEEENPYLQAKRIYDFVRKKVRYRLLDHKRGRGTTCLLEYPVKDNETNELYYEGCCSQMSAFFIAMCRSLGIPARSVFGFIGAPVYKTEEELKQPLFDFERELSPDGFAGAQHHGVMGPHMWAEFYLQDIGWIPVDPLAGLFGELFSSKVIMAKGRDILLGPDAPKNYHHGYGSQWVPLHDGRVDFPFYAVWNIAKIDSAKLKIIHHPIKKQN